MKYTIIIPEPCHENWGAMTETAKGKFCGSCKKEVVDFSNTSIAKLTQRLDSGSKLCGRFRPDQLGRTIRSSKGSAIRQRGVMVAAVALLAAVSPVVVQSQEPTVVDAPPLDMIFGRIAVHPQQETKPIGYEIVTITGTVRSGIQVLAGADIQIKGTLLKTKTDSDGKFEIPLKDSKLYPSVILEVSHIDHEPREIEVHQADTPIDIELSYQDFILGEIEIIENPNLIDRVKNTYGKIRE